MSDSEFWRMMDSSRAQAADDIESQIEVLIEELSKLPVEEIISYATRYLYHLDEAYDQRLWAAGYVIEELSDDDFHDFRAWLISRGKDVFYRCLKDPEELTTVAITGRRITAERMNSVAREAFKLKTGDDTWDAIYPGRSTPPQILNPGLRWKTESGYADPQSLRKLFPRLWSVFQQ